MQSLKSKMTIVTSLFMAVTLSMLAFFALVYFENQLKKMISSQQFTMVSAIADQIDDKLQAARTELTAVAGTITPDILADPVKAQKFITGRPDTLAMFDNGVFLFSPAGKLIAGSPLESQMLNKDYSDRDYFKQTMATRTSGISEPFLSMQTHRHPVIALTAPIFDASGEITAIMAGGIDLMKDNFLGRLASIRLGDKGYLYLYNTSRMMIVHPVRERILKRDVPPGVNRLFDKALEGFEGTGATITSKGLHSISSFKRLESTGWILAANFPESEAYAPVYRAKRYLLMALAVVLIGSVLVVWLFMKHLTAPLLSFTGQIRELTGKKASQIRIRVETSDEIGILAEAFNAMLAELDAQKKELQKQLHFSQLLIDTIPNPVFYKDAQGEYLGCNKAFEVFSGLPKEQLIGKTVFDIAVPHRAEIHDKADRELCQKQGVKVCETSVEYADGTLHDAIYFKATFLADDGTLGGLIGTILDITERKSLENQLRHAQKMEALGTFSGGIAHDFNNILTAITAYCALIERKTPVDSPVRPYLNKLLASADRATALTRGLLAYSRKQPFHPQLVELNLIIAKVDHLLSRLLVEDIELAILPSDGSLIVLADSLQVEQVLMNLATNARDAMPHGGGLQIGTDRVELGLDFIKTHGYGQSGSYAIVTVSDSGSGMDEKTRERIFEPFFTTKAVDKGTGLGLSIAYGIIKQHNGYINVYSEPGKGTTFTIYLPLTELTEGKNEQGTPDQARE